MSTESKKCFCDGTRGTDCYWCQGTGYIIEKLNLNTSKAPLAPVDAPSKPKNENLDTFFKKIGSKNEKNRFEKRKKYYKKIEKILSNIRSVGVDKWKPAPPVLDTEEKPSKNRPESKPAPANEKSKEKLITCEHCKALINVNRLSKHKTKCPVLRKKAKEKSLDGDIKKVSKRSVKHKKTHQNTQIKKPIVNPNIEISDTKREYQAERRLDGSRDFYKIREQGKFGSHSVYDDMGDEANT